MPSKNEAQRRALFAKKGEKWVKAHGFDKVDPKGGSHRKSTKKK